MSPVTLPAREPQLAFDVFPVSFSCLLHSGVQTESVLYAGRFPRCRVFSLLCLVAVVLRQLSAYIAVDHCPMMDGALGRF